MALKGDKEPEKHTMTVTVTVRIEPSAIVGAALLVKALVALRWW
ncbi:MAG: hypothetical protein Q7J52_24100 [Falsiroseomonas sp.]|nr:hypothetical protein [Falsiroseomonas sp.]